MHKESETWVHQPILQEEMLDFFQIEADSVVLDCTAGEGGHSELFFQNMQGGMLLLMDRDIEILNRAQNRLLNLQKQCRKKSKCPKVLFEKANFSDLDEILERRNIRKLNYLLYDLGVSLYHFRSMGRGFSFHDSQSLDMRLDLSDLSNSLTVKEVLNFFPEKKLAWIFKNYGEEPRSRALARHIVHKRQSSKLETAYQLSCWIQEFFDSSFFKSSKRHAKNKTDTHPATRSFQALRIYVNQELFHIEKGLEIGIRNLAPGGKIAILTFHSLEDRIVKKVLRKYSSECMCPMEVPFCQCDATPTIRLFSKKPTRPTPLEIQSNPRARSAQMRMAVKL